MFVSLGVSAQAILSRQDECVWRERDLVCITAGTTREDLVTVRTLEGGVRVLPSRPHGSEEFNTQAPAWSCGIQVAEGRICYLHARVLKEDGARKLELTVYRFDEARWAWESKPCGRLVWEGSLTPYLLNEHCILGVATSGKSFREGGRSHFFALFRKGADGAFRLKSYPDTGLDRSVFLPDGAWRYPSLGSLWLAGKAARTPRLFLLAAGWGSCWVFDTEHGRLQRFVQLYSDVDDARMASGELWGGALLGVQPKANGDFLLSALDRDAVRQGWHMERRNEAFAHEEPRAQVQAMKDTLGSILRLNPRVDWYLLDREEKSFREEVPPMGLPDAIRSAEEYQGFRWTFKPDGNLAFGQAAGASSGSAKASGTSKARR